MPKKKEPLPKPVYPPIPEDFVFPDGLDALGPKQPDDTVAKQMEVFIKDVFSRIPKTRKIKPQNRLNIGGIDIYTSRDLPENTFKFVHVTLPKQEYEAEWVTKIRDYCKENSIYPIHILDFYREHHTEKAPD